MSHLLGLRNNKSFLNLRTNFDTLLIGVQK